MKSTYTKWEGISNLQSNGMLSELCSGSGDCDFVYWEILKCCPTRVRNLGIIWSLSNTGRQLEPRGVGGKERGIYE